MFDFTQFVASKGFGKAIDEFTSILKNDKKNIQKVEVVTRPYEYGKPILKRVTTSSNSKPDTPSLTIENPFPDRDVRIFAIGLVPTAPFKTNGRLEIQINDVPYLEEESAATFTDIKDSSLPIPAEGELLKAGASVDFYIRNDDNSTSVSLTVMLYIGARRS